MTQGTHSIFKCNRLWVQNRFNEFNTLIYFFLFHFQPYSPKYLHGSMLKKCSITFITANCRLLLSYIRRGALTSRRRTSSNSPKSLKTLVSCLVLFLIYINELLAPLYLELFWLFYAGKSLDRSPCYCCFKKVDVNIWFRQTVVGDYELILN